MTFPRATTSAYARPWLVWPMFSAARSSPHSVRRRRRFVPALRARPKGRWRRGRPMLRSLNTRRMASSLQAERKKILVVDDEPQIVEVVERYLADEGFAVSCAYDGAQ